MPNCNQTEPNRGTPEIPCAQIYFLWSQEPWPSTVKEKPPCPENRRNICTKRKSSFLLPTILPFSLLFAYFLLFMNCGVFLFNIWPRLLQICGTLSPKLCAPSPGASLCHRTPQLVLVQRQLSVGLASVQRRFSVGVEVPASHFGLNQP